MGTRTGNCWHGCPVGSALVPILVESGIKGGLPSQTPDDINNRFMQYYSDFYSTTVDYETADLVTYLDGVEFPTLSLESISQLE